MHSLYANTWNETYKLFARGKTRLTLVLTALIPIAAAFMAGTVQSGAGIAAGSDFALRMLGLFTALLLPLFLFMIAADLFAGEVAARTMKNVLVRPIARSSVFASKVLAMAIWLAVLLALLGIVSAAAGLLLREPLAPTGLFDALLAYAAAFVAMLAIGLLAIFVAQWFGGSASALVLCLFLFIGAKLLPFWLPQAAVWSMFSYTDWHTLWLGSAIPFGTVSNVFVFLLANCIISYTAGLFLFSRKQF